MNSRSAHKIGLLSAAEVSLGKGTFCLRIEKRVIGFQYEILFFSRILLFEGGDSRCKSIG